MDDNPFMQPLDVSPNVMDAEFDNNCNNNPFMDDDINDYGPIDDFADNLDNPFGNDDLDFIKM